MDSHMLKSVFLGYDENGKEKFENTRTELGDLIYRFKYKKDKSCLNGIMEMIKDVLDKWNLKEKIDVVIPVPPSNKKSILVIDDLFSTGATLNEVCRVLKTDDNIDKIYCLALTKTKG